MKHHALAFLVVFIGGGLGSMLRHAVNQRCAVLFGINFPSGTLTINIVGSFAIGLLAGWFAFRGDGQLLRLFLATAILGGFTIFSTFSLDTVLLLERGQTAIAALYVDGSISAGIVGVLAGLSAMRALL